MPFVDGLGMETICISERIHPVKKNFAKYPKKVQDVLLEFSLDSHDNPRLANLLVAPGMQQDSI